MDDLELLKTRGNARDYYTIGDRVVRSERGAQHGAPATHCFGVVVGFSFRLPYCILVLRDGLKFATSYHMLFWDKTDGTPSIKWEPVEHIPVRPSSKSFYWRGRWRNDAPGG